jgi:hypothetical protein
MIIENNRHKAMNAVNNIELRRQYLPDRQNRFGKRIHPEGRKAKPIEKTFRPEGREAKPLVKMIRPEGRKAKPIGKTIRPKGREAKSIGKTIRPEERKAKPIEKTFPSNVPKPSQRSMEKINSGFYQFYLNI